MIFDTLKNISKYKGLNFHLDKAIDFVMSSNEEFKKSEEGRFDIDDSFYYTKATIKTSNCPGEVPFEAHRRYIDIFIPLSGRETVRTTDIKNTELYQEYNEEDDFLIVTGKTQVTTINTPETFTICFPQDAHNSAIGVDGETIDFEKIVVKVKV